MSSALVRQALDFVDPDESSGKRKKRGGAQPKQRSSGQDLSTLKLNDKKSKNKNLKKTQKTPKKNQQVTQEVVAKLLQLSKPTIDKKVARKIVKRAVTGKPVGDKIKVKKAEPEKSILFPEESSKQFKKDPFCR